MILRIFHTNDLHCNYEMMIKTLSYLKKHRNSNDLYFDSGDLSDLKDLIVQADNGYSLAELFSLLDSDGITLGNGEIDLGSDGVERVAEKLEIICTNVTHNDGSEIRGVIKSRIINRGSCRFLILGISPYYRGDMTCNNYNVFSMMNNLMVVEPIAALKEEIDRNEGRYDYIILLSHSGVVVDEFIKQQLPVIDIVLGGHSHEVFNGPLYSQSGKGEYLGVLEIEVNDNGIHELCNEQLCLEEGADLGFGTLLEDKKKYADEVLSKELPTIEELDHDALHESRLVNFICDAMLKEYGGDLAIMHNGIAEKSLSLPVSRKTLVANFPSKLNPTKYPLKGKKIREAVRASFDQEYISGSGKGPGFRGSILGTLSYSHNVSIRYGGSPVICVNGEELQDDKIYTVVADDYLQRGSGYPMLRAKDEDARFYGWFIRDLVRYYLEDKEVFESSKIRRIKNEI